MSSNQEPPGGEHTRGLQPAPRFNEPPGPPAVSRLQRQSPAVIISRFVGHLSIVLPIGAISILTGGRGGVFTALFAAVFSSLAALWHWYSVQYELAEDSIILHKGLLFKDTRTVPHDRVSAVQTQQQLLHRIFGLTSLTVQTAGKTGEPEISLGALTLAQAAEIQHRLSSMTASGKPASAAVADDAPAAELARLPSARASSASESLLFQMTSRETLISGLIGLQLVLLPLAAAGGVLANSRDLISFDWVERQFETNKPLLVTLALASLVVVPVVGIAYAWVFNHNFTVVRRGDRLNFEHGLLTRRTGEVEVVRIQAIRSISYPIVGLLGYRQLRLEVAGLSDSLGPASTTIAPAIHHSRVAEFVAAVDERLVWPVEALERPQQRTARRYFTVPILWAAALSAAVAVPVLSFTDSVWPLAAVPVFLILGALLGLGRWRAAGIASRAGCIAVSWRGLLVRQLMLARSARLQEVQLSTNPFQRRANLSTLQISVATGSTAAIRHLSANRCAALQAELMAMTVVRRLSLLRVCRCASRKPRQGRCLELVRG